MIKIEMEYIMRSSSRVLYNRLSTAAGLSEWFADDVTVQKNIYTFEWDGSKESAELISKKDLQYARFKWLEADEGTYFEFKIQAFDVTKDISLVITDFVEEDEKESSIDLWESQINNLKHILGA